MAEDSGPELPYGHFGNALYSRQQHGWHFERHSSLRTEIVPFLVLDRTDSAFQAGHDDPKEADTVRSVRYAKQIAALSQAHVGTHLPDDLLPALLRESELVQEATCQMDSSSGDLMAFTHAKSPRRPGCIDLAVIVDANVRSKVRCIPMAISRLHWRDDRHYCLDVPTLRGKGLSWDFAGAPVQQVCCTSDDDITFHVAVRQATTVRVLRFRMPRSRFVDSPPELVMIGSVNAHDLYLDLLANISFSPWTSRQISIVDRRGKWRILDVNGSSIKHICTSDDADVNPLSQSRLEDGWARVEWLVDAAAATVVLCTRFGVSLWSVADERARHIENIDGLKLPSRLPWILDLKVLPLRRDHFALLTPTHVMLYKASRIKFGDVHAICVAKARHFMNIEDVSMRLTVGQEHNDTVLIISSNFTTVQISYRVIFGEHGTMIVQDPQRIHTSTTVNFCEKQASCIQMHIRPLHLLYQGAQGRAYDVDGQAQFSPFGQSIRFCSVISLHGDMRLSECLAFSQDKSESVRELDFVEARADKLGPSSGMSSRARKPGSILEGEEGLRHCPRPRYFRRIHQRQQASQHPKDFRPIYDLLNTSSPLPIERLLLEEAYEFLDKELVQDAQVNQTLSEVVDCELTTGDIEEAADALRQFSEALKKGHDHDVEIDVSNQVDTNTRLALLRVASMTEGAAPPSDDFSDLLPLYNSLVATYITPLSPSVSGRLRVAKDRLVRMLAAELVLSGLVVRHQEHVVKDQQSDTHIAHTPMTLELPYRGHRDSSPLVPASSQVLPTPPPTTPSVTTASSRSSLLAAPEVERLRKYADFSKPAPPPLPRALTNVLDHWSIGTDPASYDWLATSRNISRQSAAAEDEMTEKERKRVRRKAERLLLRQRKEAAASEALRLASSQAPEILSASQPGVLRNFAPSATQQPAIPASSQSMPNADYSLPMASQPMPGRFGGRPPPKKKRKQGF